MTESSGGKSSGSDDELRGALDELERRLARACRAARTGLWEWDFRTEQVWWSDETWEIFGLEPKAAPLSTELFYSLIVPEDRARVARECRTVPAERASFSVRYRIRLASGQTRVILEHGGLEEGTGGTPLRITGTVQDVTERVRAEEVVAEFAALGRRLTAAASLREAAMTIMDAADRLLGWDSAFLKLDIGGGRLQTVVAVDLVDGKLVEEHPLFADEAAADYFQRVVPDGSRLLFRDENGNPSPGLQRFGNLDRHSRSLLFVPLRTGPAIIGVVSIQSYVPDHYDASSLRTLEALADHCTGALERLLMENRLRDLNRDLETRVEMRTAELVRANAELERATRLKDEFLAAMSHELRTPLNAILGLSEAIREGVYGDVPEKQAKPLRRIEDSGRNLLELINQILDLSKIEAGRLELAFEEFDVAEIARQAMRFVHTDARRKGLAVETELDPAASKAWGDPRRLRQALVNLLANAVKFTSGGGTIGLRVESDRAAREIRFVVHDTGIGIAPEMFSRLFVPFSQLDGGLTREHGGSGLGLALVKKLAVLHEGRVTVQSEPGKGSRFTIHLPWDPATMPAALRAAPAPSDEPSPRPALSTIPARAGSTIRSIAKLLGERNIRTTLSRTAGDVVRIAPNSRPVLIVLDAVDNGEAMTRLFARLGKSASLAGIPTIYVGAADNIDNSTLAELRLLEAEGEPESRVEALIEDALEDAEGDTALILTNAPSKQPRVLLAEDNEIVRTSLSEYLTAKGCEVVQARDGEEAIQLAVERSPDMILMDVQMPRLDGLEATRRLRAHESLSAVPIIALTALAMPGDKERCLQAGANDYLSKPVSLRRLCDIVDHYASHAETD